MTVKEIAEEEIKIKQKLENLEVLKNELIHIIDNFKKDFEMEADMLKHHNFNCTSSKNTWSNRLFVINKKKDFLDDLSGALLSIELNIWEFNMELDDLSKDNKSSEEKFGFVYIAKQQDNIYKIGITKDIEARRKSLKTGNPFIEIIATKRTHSYYILEKQLHDKFTDKNINGEWFSFTDSEIKGIIIAFGFVSAISEKIEN